MADTYPVDYTSAVGRVRKYIPDVRQLDGEYIFTDEEIQSFIDDNIAESLEEPFSYEIRRAAAWAMIAIANDETLILKKIKTEDLETDGPAVGKQLLAAAQELLKRAEIDEVTASRREDFLIVTNPYAPSPPPYLAVNGFYPRGIVRF